MNFLAHIYLSGENDLIKIGNFMADGIRGKKFENYHPDIQKGILMHREIDTFTDNHPIFKKSTKRLHDKYHHYSGIIIDIFYDHFLAKNWTKYSDEPLDVFVDNFYSSLKTNYDLLSERTKEIMPYMIEQNWLYNYRTTEGIARILIQMDNRIQNSSNMRFSIEDLLEFYNEFEEEFSAFFEELITFSKSKLILYSA
ncbi:MAG: ACP phosphodiesterase [Flavobacterium sp.]